MKNNSENYQGKQEIEKPLGRSIASDLIANTSLKIKNNNFRNINFIDWIKIVYFLGVIFLLIRLILSLLIIFRLYLKSRKIDINGNTIHLLNRNNYSFSFFNWIFIPKDKLKSKELDYIIIHEKTHSQQFHSIDNIISELYCTFFWFNPLIWIMKSKLKLIHEYLADENVIKNGIDEKSYQAGLLNQIAGYQLVNIGSNYFQSIKKRIIMMTNNKTSEFGKYKLISLFAMLLLSVTIVGFINGQTDNNASVAMELSKMNILYIGVENPLNIAVSGVDNSKLQVSIDNGEINGSNGEYIITVKEPGEAKITVSADGKELKVSKFRVKSIPVPGIENSISLFKEHSHKITKEKLLHWGSIEFMNKYCDYNLGFGINVIYYRMVIEQLNGDGILYIGHSKSFDDRQLELIKKLKKGEKIFFEHIMVASDMDDPKLIGYDYYEIE